MVAEETAVYGAFGFWFWLLAWKKEKGRLGKQRKKTDNCEHLSCLESSIVPQLRPISIEHLAYICRRRLTCVASVDHRGFVGIVDEVS